MHSRTLVHRHHGAGCLRRPSSRPRYVASQLKRSSPIRQRPCGPDPGAGTAIPAIASSNSCPSPLSLGRASAHRGEHHDLPYVSHLFSLSSVLHTGRSTGAPGCTPMSQVPLVVAFHLGGRPRCCGCCCSRGKVSAHSGQTSIAAAGRRTF